MVPGEGALGATLAASSCELPLSKTAPAKQMLNPFFREIEKILCYFFWLAKAGTNVDLSYKQSGVLSKCGGYLYCF